MNGDSFMKGFIAGELLMLIIQLIIAVLWSYQ